MISLNLLISPINIKFYENVIVQVDENMTLFCYDESINYSHRLSIIPYSKCTNQISYV